MYMVLNFFSNPKDAYEERPLGLLFSPFIRVLIAQSYKITNKLRSIFPF